jgi:hypothetical protein
VDYFVATISSIESQLCSSLDAIVTITTRPEFSIWEEKPRMRKILLTAAFNRQSR